jgi:hypothetical protein
MPLDEFMEQLRVFAAEVIPAFQRQAAAAAGDDS